MQWHLIATYSISSNTNQESLWIAVFDETQLKQSYRLSIIDDFFFARFLHLTIIFSIKPMRQQLRHSSLILPFQNAIHSPHFLASFVVVRYQETHATAPIGIELLSSKVNQALGNFLAANNNPIHNLRSSQYTKTKDIVLWYQPSFDDIREQTALCLVFSNPLLHQAS